MKVLDRYIVRELLLPILSCLVTLIFLILIADLFDNLDELIRHHVPFSIIFRYYMSLVPYAFSETIAWATWLGTLFLLVNFGLHNEMIAMKVAGLKITTIVKPMLFLGFLIGIAAFLVNDRVLPKSYRQMKELRDVYIEKRKGVDERAIMKNVTYYSGQDRFYYFRKFDANKETVEDAILLWLNNTGTDRRKKIVARKGRWDGAVWRFQEVTEYQIDAQGKILGTPHQYTSKAYEEINMPPRELINASSAAYLLSYRELKNSVKQLEENGVTVYSEKVDLHFRLAHPWQGLVMMMTLIPVLAPTRNRRAIAGHVLFCVGLAFMYHLTGAVSLALGKAGKLVPFLSAWGGNVIFAVGSLFHLEKGNH